MTEDDPEVLDLLEQLPERARPFVLAELRSRVRVPELSVEERAIERAERLEAEARRDAEANQMGAPLSAGIMWRQF